jgi:hypothetical protein
LNMSGVSGSAAAATSATAVWRWSLGAGAAVAFGLFGWLKYRQRRDRTKARLLTSLSSPSVATTASNVLKFHKYHGTGNDFVIVDCFDEATAATVAAAGEPGSLAQRVLHRHFGVGGDGLIRVVPPRMNTPPGHAGDVIIDAEMIIHNADGSYAEMCGNGLRAMAKYVHDVHRRGHDRLILATGAGIKYATITQRDLNGNASMIRLDMGEPKLKPSEIP